MSHILTLSDRTVIQTLLKVGYSQKQIAEEVGRTIALKVVTLRNKK